MAAFEHVEIGDVDGQRFVQRLLGIEHDHRCHQLGDRGDRRDVFGILAIDLDAVAAADDQRVGGEQLQFGRVRRDRSRGSLGANAEKYCENRM